MRALYVRAYSFSQAKHMRGSRCVEHLANTRGYSRKYTLVYLAENVYGKYRTYLAGMNISSL